MGISFFVVGYCYFILGYYLFQDFVDNFFIQCDCCMQSGRMKGWFDVLLLQMLFGYGLFLFLLVNEIYWDSLCMELVGVGYSGLIGKVFYFINYFYNCNV